MCELAARHFIAHGAAKIYVANRTFERGVALAKKFNGEAMPIEHLYDTVDNADIVFSSTGAPVAIFRKEHGEKFLSRRKNRPMFFLDIAVPRDVDAKMNDLDGIFVYNIDDLQQVVQSHLSDRTQEAQHAEDIVNSEVEKFEERLRTLDVVPTIVSLQEHLETVRQAEIDRVRGRLGELSPEQELAVEAMTRGIINKIMHTPITTLKTAASEPESTTVIELVRRIFNLREKAKMEAARQPVQCRADPAARESRPQFYGDLTYRFPRFATGLVAGQPHLGAAARAAGTKWNSRSSRPPATRFSTWRSPRSAPRACSPRRSRKLWRPAKSILRSTA